MTIMATHFAVVLGAWRLRVRIDLDEPHETELRDDAGESAPRAPSTSAPLGNDGWAASAWRGESRFGTPS